MELIQIIILLFAFFAYSRVILRFKDKNISFKEFLLWTIIWIGIIAVSLIPNVVAWFSRKAGIGRPVDLLVYSSIILLFYLIFRMYVKIENTEQQITKLVRTITINEKKGIKKKTKKEIKNYF